MYRGAPYLFENRYQIRGTLTTLSPLHVGDGDTIGFHNRNEGTNPQDDPECNSMCANHLGKAMIPGSSLKGVLRAWAHQQGISSAILDALFGIKDSGGKVRYNDCFLIEPAPGKNDDRWWHPGRGTCLAPGVSLNPKTRTAAEHLLYYTEFAPEQSKFEVVLTAQDLSVEELGTLLAIMKSGFGPGRETIAIGAETADGWGKCEFKQNSVELIEASDVSEWLKNPIAKCKGRSVTPAIPALPAAARPRVYLDIELTFEGGMLVNDPSQFRKRNETQGVEDVGHASIKRRDGSYFLPSSSVRGALRGQARRIWQTLANGTAKEVPEKVPEIKNRRELKDLHAFFRMVGAPGWRTPLEIPDFKIDGNGKLEKQEFVAIDRFMGGAADDKKFSATALWRPKMSGRIVIDLAMWQRAQVTDWAWMLLLFTLRDLVEGDVYFGFGRSKGYGKCTAKVTASAVGGGETVVDVSLLNDVLSRRDLSSPILEQWHAELSALVQ